jgi:hypothetical protein
MSARDGVPTILVSSRDNAPVPPVAGAARLEKAATAAGWAARQTYALVELPESRRIDGELRRESRRLASVAVRMHRGGVRAWAIWQSVDDGPWKFDSGQLGLDIVGLRALTGALTR